MNRETKVASGKASEGIAQGPHSRSRTIAWSGAAVAIAVFGIGGFAYTHRDSVASSPTHAPSMPQVSVSKPLVRELDTRLGFLGQLSPVNQVELRAQVGGTLTGIHFVDGDIVHAGETLFTIDSVPYEIKLAQAQAQLETAKARLTLAEQELARAQELERNEAGTMQNVEQRTSEQQAGRAAVDDAQAQIRDARFDLDHCRIVAPFTGRIGTHLVSVGNLVAGSRAATSPTTLLATLVSLDPIYLNFDMSESDFQGYSTYRARSKAASEKNVELALSNEKAFTRRGTLDFIDNVLDRSSGTIHARATVPNPDLTLTSGEFVRLRLAVAHPQSTLLVPDASVLPDQSQHVVMTVSADGTVTPKPVEIGDMRGGLRVIRSGLNANDRVIIDGLPYVAPGARVTTRDGAIRYVANQD